MKKTWTLDEVFAYVWSQSHAQFKKLWGRRRALPLSQIMALPIDPKDRMRIAEAFLSPDECRVVNTKIAERVIAQRATSHPITAEWAKDWLSGKDRSVKSLDKTADALHKHIRETIRSFNMLAWAVESGRDSPETGYAAMCVAKADSAIDAEYERQVAEVLEVLSAKAPTRR